MAPENRLKRLLLLALLLVCCHVKLALATCNENENSCTAEFLKNVTATFSASNITIQDLSAINSALNMAYENFSARCRGKSQTSLRAVRLLTPTLSEGDQAQQLSQRFTRTTGYRLEYTMQTAARITEEVLFQAQTNGRDAGYQGGKRAVSLYDAWVLDIPSSAAVLQAGAVASLEELAAAAQDQLLDSDVHPFLHKYGAMYGKRRTAVVLSSIVPLLYWRRDLLAAVNLTAPPATWEELLEVAAVLNGTDLNGDGRPDAALCWQLQGCGESGMVLGNILASMTQYQGSTSGWLFEPEDMTLLAAGAPLLRALDLLRNLTRLEARGSKGCAFLHTAFFNGTCAFTIKTAQQFKTAQLRYPHLHGLVGVAPLPGSSWVWDRAAGSWMSCGAETTTTASTSRACPYATLETPLAVTANRTVTATVKAARAARAVLSTSQSTGLSSRPGPSSGPTFTGPTTTTTTTTTQTEIVPVPSSSGTRSARSGNSANGSGGSGLRRDRRRRMATSTAAAPPPSTPLRAAEGCAGGGGSGCTTSTTATATTAVASIRIWVNRAPLCGMTALLGSVDVRTPPDYAAAAFSFFALLTSPNMSWALLGTETFVGPFRQQHLDPANTARWLAMNYSEKDLNVVALEPFLESTRLALEHPNAALPLRLPGATAVRDVLYWASQQVLTDPSSSLEAVVSETQSRMKVALESVGLLPGEIQRAYWETIGYKGPDPPPYSAQSWFAARAARVGVGLAVAVAGGALLVLAGVLWHRRRQSRRRRTLFGRAMAPGASPATSLVVTDIVDSTRLWETVSPAAMTRAVQLHHETLRSLLQLHNGYESATEGDAFILSFYSAADAVAFALRAQAALLYQPWPEELFQHAPCKPQYAVCQVPGGAPDRTRAGIPRLPFGTHHGGLPGLGSQQAAAALAAEDGNFSAGGGSGCGGVGGVAAAAAATAPGGGSLEEHLSSGWLAVSNSQLPLSSTKLKMVTSALSLPLKRRLRAPYDGGVDAASASIAGLSVTFASNTPAQQIATASPQSVFKPMPSAPPLPLQSRDGFASQSLSQLLLNGSISVRSGGHGGGGGGSDAAGGEGSAGRSGGGSSRNLHSLRATAAPPQRHGDSHKLGQLRLGMSRIRNTSASAVPYTAPGTARGLSSKLLHCNNESENGGVLESRRDAARSTAAAAAAAAAAAVERVASDPLRRGGGGSGGGGGSTVGAADDVRGVWRAASAPIPVATPTAEIHISRSGSLREAVAAGARDGDEALVTAVEIAVAASASSAAEVREDVVGDAGVFSTAESGAATAQADSAGAAGSTGNSDALTAATFTGHWLSLGPPAAGSAMKSPGMPGVESDPEPDRVGDPDSEYNPRLHPGPERRPARRTRGSRVRRTRPLTNQNLTPIRLISEGKLPAPVVTTAAPRAPMGGFSVCGGGGCSGGFPTADGGGLTAPGSAAAVSGIISTSGALSASLGLIPYRRTSMPSHFAALMGGGATGGSSGPEHPNSGSGHGARSGNGGGGVIRSLPLGAYYRQMFRACQPGAPGAVLVAGGLSVRMGVHSGVASTQVSYNRVAGRTQYSGAALEAAKAVCDAAQGGMVLLGSSAFEQLALARGAGASGGREPPAVVLHMGSHVIKAETQPQELYMAQSRELLPRLAFLGPVRSADQLDPGALEAPLGEVSMGTVVVVGLPTLMASNKEMAEEALVTFRRVVVEVAMRRLGGHLVEEGQGRVMAVFGHPFDAIRWAAACEALLKEADWSEALLSHELAEEVQGPVLLDSHVDAPVLMGDGELSRMLFRGLRIKGAVDCARVKAELVPATGRLSYRGALAHNVQRIAAYVSTGQVVCTRRAWRGYESALDLAAQVAGVADVVGACLGLHSIRGIGDKVELWSIRLEDLTYEASYHQGMRLGTSEEGEGEASIDGGGGGGGGRRRLLLPSPLPVTAAATVELASPLVAAGASVGGDNVGSRLGASLADTMAAQAEVWKVTGEELRNMLSE
ncbi:hypothetical protein VOLCADRAFT_98288 [Volvox carteri f. nagariensis]|uniref:Guanylate cyclase domain-containing protein n=1 Tax=Volvox carteri f. nagariensis TaxID=3068 RepID=D8UET9_VOLCA|nr:uncharacterized protein VOLCADRAFT_98288 [Volvox carteri f. nagariensis]EFJ41699.1 hypothetical protein VOLCADRAFT_98288 [Volvox carteri f. nagariensis]|eukprot:XP_002957201.1 hypothetical protein VOLCADRAFT_98288 [Volvox carteri f. nagariensis]